MRTEILRADGIARAAEIIRAGGLVAVPTETFYGLAADGRNAEAVEKIYAVKGRPEVKPLSLMVHDASAMRRCWSSVPEAALSLAGDFWPGPLTIIYESGDNIPGIVRAGGPTVGLRCPDHPLTLALLAECGAPLAAPSANPSGSPSPKTPAQVLEYFDGKIDAVIDGGECGIGLESTIITLASEPYRILRQGALGADEISARLAADMCIIGLTGGTGTGKTTALGVLRSMGALCLDCDGIYHRLTRESEELKAALTARFGEVYKDGALDRKALGRIVFSDPEALRGLNSITHGFVTAETHRLLREYAMAGGSLAAIDAVGLVEAGEDGLCTAVFGVLAPREARIERVVAREGVSREYAASRVDAQKPDSFYLENCSACLLNDGTRDEFAAKCRAAFEEVIRNGRKERLPRRALL